MRSIDERAVDDMLDSLVRRYERAGFESASFVRDYWARVAPADLLVRDIDDLHAIALAQRRLARVRGRGAAVVRVYNPTTADDGWQSPHSAVDVIVEDSPFVVDSVLAALVLHERVVHFAVTPVLRVVRDEAGAFVSFGEGGAPESWIHVEIDRLADPNDASSLEGALVGALHAVALSFVDFVPMRALAIGIADEVADDEHRAVLRWLADGHFVFLGAVDDESLLGTLRATAGVQSELRELIDAAFETGAPFVFTSTSLASLVHRSAPMVLVAGSRRDEATSVVRRWAFVGLLTNAAYRERAIDVPLVRRLIADVLGHIGFPADSHEASGLLAILEDYPRDELFQMTADVLRTHSLAVLHARHRSDVQLHVRRDVLGRFVSCLVYFPADRFNTTLRMRVQQLLVEAFGGTRSSFTTTLSSHGRARLHVMVHGRFAADLPAAVSSVERRIAQLSQGWNDELRAALFERHGEGAGLELFEQWRDGFDAGYRDAWSGHATVDDIERLEALAADDLSVRVDRAAAYAGDEMRLRVFRSGSEIALSDFLPILRDLGLTVLHQRPFECRALGRPPRWVYEFSIRSAHGSADEPASRRRLEDALLAVWHGQCESDSLGDLVLGAGLAWREVALLRSIRQYLRQTGAMFSKEYYGEALRAHPHLARTLVDAFLARFDPSARDEDRAVALLLQYEREVDQVTSLDEDRILRSFGSVVRAVVRTGYFQVDADGVPLDRIVVKIDSRAVAELPDPRPRWEIFVYTTYTEGVHLRMGMIARGGLRASDRREDYRTEVLGLMKAQNVKNAVIVPLGAKGGFIVRKPVTGDRASVQAEVIRCYRTFVEGLLDVTDNRVGGEVVAPGNVVRLDGDDPYLVVAADKGTATFSDIANEIAIRRGFWLGDAFASGGSVGYDHKAMGITARGAWESVRRHFRQVDIDVDTDPLSAVGIGDMSGDVFGNGLLLSRSLSLVAAFDHRHIFVDPCPDPAAAWHERRRLFDLPASSWNDYDPALISAGGGVFSRSAKSIAVSEQVRAVLGIDTDLLTPEDLVRAVLAAPVDLWWNGGVGTYVKASSESHAAAADRVNDAVRIDATHLRCRVVGEGGNLGLTQHARIQFARRGGFVNTDAIDNSAGVDCSDHEVNIKIALEHAVADGQLTRVQRNELLAAMTDEVAGLVLADNYAQNVALTAARAQAPLMVDVHERHLAWLESVAGLDRRLEGLPTDAELDERELAGQGLSQPELAVVLAYTKNQLELELLGSDLPTDPENQLLLQSYFPSAMRERFGDRIEAHPLRAELVSTLLANDMVNRAGISMAHRMQEETSASTADIARAHIAAWHLFDLDSAWRELSELDGRVGAATQTACFLEVKKLGERATRWLLRNHRANDAASASMLVLRDGARAMSDLLHDVVPDAVRADLDASVQSHRESGVPSGLAARIAAMPLVITALDVCALAGSETKGASPQRDLRFVARVYFLVEERLGCGVLRNGVTQLPRNDRWNALARAALRDDFFAAHRDLTAIVLASDTEAFSPEALVDGWLDARGPLARGAQRLVEEIRASGTGSLAQLSVALRELRNVAHQGAR